MPLFSGAVLFMRLVTIILFLSALPVHTYCQYENLKFRQFDEKNGLSNNNVNCMVQDMEGFIWIGTDNGLNRFDGYSFRNYMSDSKDSLSLIHDHILTFFQSSDSELWIGTQYGICRYQNRTDNFKQFRRGYTDGYIRGFYEDNKGNIFTVNDKGQIFSISNDRLILEKAFNFHLYSYLYDSEGNHWFGTDRGLYFYNTSDDSLHLYQIQKKIHLI